MCSYLHISLNKKMKTYINFFYAILDKIDTWDLLDKNRKIQNTFDQMNRELVFKKN